MATQYDYFSIEAAQADIGDVSRLPFSMKVLLENLLRYEDGRTVSVDDVKAVAAMAQRSAAATAKSPTARRAS